QVVGLVIQSQNPRLHVFPEPHIPSHATSIDQRRYRLKAILVADALAVHGASESEGRVARVFSHTVIRLTSNRRAIDMTLSPLSWAVCIASSCLAVKGVRLRLFGSVTAPARPESTVEPDDPRPRLASSHTASSRSTRFHSCDWSPPASTLLDLSTVVQ